MFRPFLPAIALLLLTSCSSNTLLAKGLVATSSNNATATQLENCKTAVGERFADVSAADITVSASFPDAQGNAVIDWQTSKGATGYCRVTAANAITQFVVERDPASSPTPSPSATSTPSPSPSPTPSPSPFSPQSLVGLDRNEAISIAQNNGYYITDVTDANKVYLSNNVQQLVLNIGQPFNTVSSATVSQISTPSPTPSPTSSPTPSPDNTTNDQLQSCRNSVGAQYPNAPYADISVNASAQDAQGNAIVNWQTRSGASGFCRVDAANNIADFVVTRDPAPSPSPVPPVSQVPPSPRPPVTGLW
jgi:hypothetical protein